MAAYRWVDDLVTCGLTACTPGSAPGPTLGNEYRKPLPILPFTTSRDISRRTNGPLIVKPGVEDERNIPKTLRVAADA